MVTFAAGAGAALAWPAVTERAIAGTESASTAERARRARNTAEQAFQEGLVSNLKPKGCNGVFDAKWVFFVRKITARRRDRWTASSGLGPARCFTRCTNSPSRRYTAYASPSG